MRRSPRALRAPQRAAPTARGRAGRRRPSGKARAAQNALKHGLRANTYVVLLAEDWDEFAALERALIAELAPAGAVQRIIAARIARASWRLMRAERLEVELFNTYSAPTGGLARALIRDGHGTRSFATVQRYRAAALAELTRCLRTLTTLQAAARAAAALAAPPRPRAAPRHSELSPSGSTRGPTRHSAPTRRTERTRAPRARRRLELSPSGSTRGPTRRSEPPRTPRASVPRARPNEPERRAARRRGKPRAHRAPAAAAARRAYAQHAADRTRASERCRAAYRREPGPPCPVVTSTGSAARLIPAAR